MAKKRKSYKKKVKRGGVLPSAADTADRDALSTTTSATTATATDDKKGTSTLTKVIYFFGGLLFVVVIIIITHFEEILEEIGNYLYPPEIILNSQYIYAQGDSVTIKPTYSNITIIPSNTFTIVPDNGLTVNKDGNITGDIDFKGANEIEFTITVFDHPPNVYEDPLNVVIASKKFTIKKKESTPTPSPPEDEDK